MAIAIKSAADIAAKWASVTPGRSSFYEAEAKVAGSAWQTAATAAASNFKQAVTAGDIDRRFSGGVRRAGAEKYNRKVAEVGASRYATGVTAAQSDMASGLDPYVSVISGLTLPARAPKGSEQNNRRVDAVTQALHRRKLSLLSSG